MGHVAGSDHLVLDHEPEGIGRLFLRGRVRDGRLELGERHLGRALRQRRPEHIFRVERDRDAFELAALVRFGLAANRRVAGAVEQPQLHNLLLTVDQDPPLSREIHHRVPRARHVGDKDVAPAAARRQVADVDHALRKVLEEHTGLDAALQPFRHDTEGDFPEFLVGVRQRHDRLVCRRGGADQRDKRDRPDEPQQADAAGLHRDEFAVRGEPAETHQDPQQHGHRDRQAERLRQQQAHRPAHDGPLDTLCDERLGLPQDRRNHQEEGEHDERDRKRERDLTNQVAVEGLEHRLTVDTSRGGGRPRPQLQRNAVVCYL